MESVYAQSTICRQCSSHFEIGKPSAPAASTPAGNLGGSIIDRFQKLLRREKIRTIRCLHCRAPQQVSSFATSTMCPQCSMYLELKDFKIATPYSRNITTQGSVYIAPKGDVTSTKVACGEATIHGKLHGNLVCTGTVRVKVRGKLSGSIDAQHVIIEKGAAMELMRTIKAHRLEIHGQMSARVMCDSVAIGKTGALEGTVYARSIAVEKGGIFHGELYIGKQELEQPELLAVAKSKKEKPRRERGGDQPTFALA
jgi:cytoskeletal protein CcmA (bactofilin family)